MIGKNTFLNKVCDLFLLWDIKFGKKTVGRPL